MYNMYDWNLDKYHVLDMTDEEYLNYCKENCKEYKKYKYVCAVICILNVILGLIAMHTNILFIVPFAFVLGGCMLFMSIYCRQESRRWKAEIHRFESHRVIEVINKIYESEDKKYERFDEECRR